MLPNSCDYAEASFACKRRPSTDWAVVVSQGHPTTLWFAKVLSTLDLDLERS
jgi:hypothetical protein